MKRGAMFAMTVAKEAGAAVCVFILLLGCAREAEPLNPVLTHQESGTTVRLQAISAVSETVAWASGLQGTVVRTIDGGRTWAAVVVPGADSLQFRDVDAIDDNTAYLLSSGPGERSRIYKTSNGGVTWTLQYTNGDPEGFFDCLALWDADHGAIYGDAVDGSLVILTTSDGETWDRVPRSAVPDAHPGEGGFAASGTCLVTHGDSTAWIGTGADGSARVIKTVDRGQRWAAFPTPIVSGSSPAGITTVGFFDELVGIAAGGEISNPDSRSDNVAVTRDGGVSWTLVQRPLFSGPIYGLAVVRGAPTRSVVAVGPGGADYSLDNGVSWVRLDSLEYWSVDFASKAAGWAVGPNGRITQIAFN
jgi:photosystem II stability/assembly factor-like uncharacterized protein